MKVIQVATLITPDNAYGGPTTVAFNQCLALAEAGHDVELVAGAKGYPGVLPTTLNGVKVRLFPSLQTLPGAGFAGVSSPAMLAWLRRATRAADMVHVHLARDLVTLPAAALARAQRKRYCVQTHGMIDPTDKLLARPLDAVLTRPVLKDAARVFYLTDVERAGLEAVAGNGLRFENLANGVPQQESSTERSGAESGVRVLYLARLQERKRPLEFIAAACALATEFPSAVFQLVGPDEGQGPVVEEALARAGLRERLQWLGPRDRAGCQAAMHNADVYVLPSVDEPYPMSVLEAMASGLPVVITDSCGLAPAVERGQAGFVATGAKGDIVAPLRALLADAELRQSMGNNARRLIESEFGMSSIRDQLLSAYGDGSA